MNRFVLQGFINTIKYLPNSCIVFVDEYKRGFTKSNGERVDEKYMTWKVVFKSYFKQYVAKHFANGMLVEIVAEMYPYAVEKEKTVDGYSCMGKTIDVASYPRSSLRLELRRIKESQESVSDEPDLESFQSDDF